MGKLVAEHCATNDFEWIGLVLPGEHEFQIFNLDDLQPSDYALTEDPETRAAHRACARARNIKYTP